MKATKLSLLVLLFSLASIAQVQSQVDIALKSRYNSETLVEANWKFKKNGKVIEKNILKKRAEKHFANSEEGLREFKLFKKRFYEGAVASAVGGGLIVVGTVASAPIIAPLAGSLLAVSFFITRNADEHLSQSIWLANRETLLNEEGSLQSSVE